MSKRTTIITLGIFVALMPFLGFPGTAETIFSIIAGLALVSIGYLLESECEKCEMGEKNINAQKAAEKKETLSSSNSSDMNNNT